MRGSFDPIGRRVLLHGGYSALWGTAFPDLIAVGAMDTLGPVHRMTVQGSAGGQDMALEGYDQARDALVVFGSLSLNNSGPSLYEFRFDRTGMVVARTGPCIVHPDRIALRWSSTPGAAFRLWRREGEGGWAPFAELSASASGGLTFDDRTVEAGRRYGYRLTSGAEASPPVSVDVWLTAATAAPFALSRPWPNPSRGALNVAFTLGAAGAAELEMFDIAGRRVWSRRLEGLAPGPHHVAVPAGETPRTGLYLLRLRQGGRAASARVVLAR